MNGFDGAEEESDFPLQPLWEAVGGIGQLADLLERLKTNSGVFLSPDRLFRLADIMHTLKARGVSFGDSGEAAAVLSPLLVTSGEAQLSAAKEIERFWSPVNEGGTRMREIPEAIVSKSPLAGARQRLASILALLLLITGVAVWIILRPNAIPEVLAPVPVPQSPISAGQVAFWDWFGNLLSSDVIHRMFAVLVVSTLALLWWKSKREGQTRLSRERSQGSLASLLTADTNRILFPTSALRRAGRLLRRPMKVQGNRIDVFETISATIEAGGFFKFVPDMASRTPDCLILIDRISRNDHLAALASSLAKRLKDGGADLLRYDFRTYPDVLEAVGRRYGGQSVLSLKAVARRHPDSRVIVVSTGRGFFEPFDSFKPRQEKPYFGEPDDSGMGGPAQSERRRARVLPSFGSGPILLTPTPPDRWGPRERALSEMGFTVIPLGNVEEPAAGLFGAVESILTERKPLGAQTLMPRHATPAEDPLMMDLERVELLSDIPPRDPLYRKKLASRIITYATRHFSETEVGIGDPRTNSPANAELEARAAVVALVLFPKISPNLTPQIWAAITGHDPTASRLSRLSRLPWFRSGHMPDWLRADIAASFQTWLDETQRSQERWHELRAQLASFATACLDRPPNADSIVVYRRPNTLNSALNELRLIVYETSPADRTFIEDRLFLTFVESGKVADHDMLSVDVGPAERPTATMLFGLLTFGVAALIAAIFMPWALRLYIEAGYASAISDYSKSVLLALNCLLAARIVFGPRLTGETAWSKATVAAGVALSIVSYPLYATIPNLISPTILPALNLVFLALPLMWPSSRNEPLISNLFDGDTSGLEFAVIFAIVSTLIYVGGQDSLDMAFLVSIILLLAFSQYSSALWTLTAAAAYFVLLLLLAAFFGLTSLSVSSQSWAAPVMMVFAGFAARRRAAGDGRSLDLKIFAFMLIAHITASTIGVVMGDSALLGAMGSTAVIVITVYVVIRGLIRLLPNSPFSRAVQSFRIATEFLGVGTVASRWPRLAGLEITGKALIFGVAAASMFGLSVWLPKTLTWVIGLRLVSEFIFALAVLHLFRLDTLTATVGRRWLWLAFPLLFLLGLVPPSYDGAMGMKWGSLGYLALPLAVFIGTRWGRPADRPILFGLFPFLLALRANGWSTPGGIWMVLVAIMITEVVRSGRLGETISALQGFFENGSTAVRVMKLLGPLLLLSMSTDATNSVGYLAIDPGPMRIMLLILLGISGIPSWPIVLALLVTTVVSQALELLGLQQRLGDTGIALYLYVRSYELFDLWIAFLAMPLATFCWRRGSSSRSTIVAQVVIGLATGAVLSSINVVDFAFSGKIAYSLNLKGPFTVPLLAWVFGAVSLWKRPTSPAFWVPCIVAAIVALATIEWILRSFGLSTGIGGFQTYAPDVAVFVGFAVFGFQSARFLASASGQISQPASRESSSYRPTEERTLSSEGSR